VFWGRKMSGLSEKEDIERLKMVLVSIPLSEPMLIRSTKKGSIGGDHNEKGQFFSAASASSSYPSRPVPLVPFLNLRPEKDLLCLTTSSFLLKTFSHQPYSHEGEANFPSFIYLSRHVTKKSPSDHHPQWIIFWMNW
jgi:hypothetical protein